MYTIKIRVNMTPDEHGWNDHIAMFSEDGECIYSGMCSTSPNPVKPSSGSDWRLSYGWIASGVYEVKTCDHHNFGRCVLVENGDAVPSRNINPNHNEKILTAVFIHEGNRGSSNPAWRGSAGCVTIPPYSWEDFVMCLPSGRGVMIIEDNTHFDLAVE